MEKKNSKHRNINKIKKVTREHLYNNYVYSLKLAIFKFHSLTLGNKK